MPYVVTPNIKKHSICWLRANRLIRCAFARHFDAQFIIMRDSGCVVLLDDRGELLMALIADHPSNYLSVQTLVMHTKQVAATARAEARMKARNNDV